MENLKPSALAAAAGISMSYASEIISGRRNPSRALAIHILRRTEWKHPILEGLTEMQISALEVIAPWSGRNGTVVRHGVSDIASQHEASTGNQDDMSGQAAA